MRAMFCVHKAINLIDDNDDYYYLSGVTQ